MHKVLILPIGTEIGLEIHRALRHSKHFKVYGISSNNNNHGRFVCENYIKENLPDFRASEFWSELAKITRKYKIDFVYPASPLLFDAYTFIPKKLIPKIILPDLNTVRVCRSKALTYQLFDSLLNVPKPELEEFPIFLKQDKGQGSSTCRIANNKQELDAFSVLEKDYLFLEYISGREFTVDCFTDRHGKLRFIGARLRNRIKNGISMNTSIARNTQCELIAQIINDKLKMRGGWFFQVKGTDILYLLEIEPRIAGTSGIWRQIGVNLPLLTLYDRLDIDMEIIQNEREIELDRALKARYKTNIKYDNVYVDFDDTLIVSNKVNIELLSFLYQCLNNKKKIYLLTRNKDVFALLKKYKISGNLFNKIITIDLCERKSKHMKHFPAIFIDDSFGERQEVSKIGVSVFDLDAVECLRGD